MTKKFVKSIDKDICQCYNDDDKKSCQRSNEYAINQTELGKLAGVSRQTISLIERGDYSPSVALALKLAKICGVQVEDIFQYEEDES